MKVSEVYFKTMKFNFIKLGIGAAITAASIVLMLICLGIAALTKSEFVMMIMICLWLGGTGGIYGFAMNYIGYMIKAAHVAIISKSVVDGQVPDNMVEVGKEMVKERFIEANAYLVLDRLVSKAVRQLQNAVGAVGKVLNFIPGMENITNILQKFIGISLGYVDECCLGYTFINKEKNAFEAGCDGVVIYFQNAKHILKDAAITTLVVMISSFLVWLVPFVVLALIFGAFGWNMFIAVILAIIIAICLKVAFVDSFMLVKMMFSYMEVAPSTEISFDLYEKLCSLSRSFKQLWEKAKAGVTGKVVA